MIQMKRLSCALGRPIPSPATLNTHYTVQGKREFIHKILCRMRAKGDVGDDFSNWRGAWCVHKDVSESSMVLPTSHTALNVILRPMG